MAGEQERHHLVTQLLVGHAAAVLVARLQQHRQEIAMIHTAVAGLLDVHVDNGLKASPRIDASMRVMKCLMKLRFCLTSTSSIRSGWLIRKTRLGPNLRETISPYSRAQRLKNPSVSRRNSGRLPLSQ